MAILFPAQSESLIVELEQILPWNITSPPTGLPGVGDQAIMD